MESYLHCIGSSNCVVHALSQRGIGQHNEDAWGHVVGKNELVVWVIDGASGVCRDQLGLSISDAAWYAGRLSAEFAAFPPASCDIREYLAAVIERMRDAYCTMLPGRSRVAKVALPSAAILWVRLRVERFKVHLDAWWLGDCSLIVQPTGPAAQLIGAPGELSLSRHDQRLSCDPQARRDGRLLARLKRQRARMNTKSGYWICSIDPRAAWQARSTTLEMPMPTTLLLMSDGFSRILDLFHAVDELTLLHGGAAGLPGTVARLRELEDGIDSMDTHPRVKVSDDATAVHISLEPIYLGEAAC